MAYKISEGCVCCQKCTFACPKQAIRFDGEQFVIDPEKCISCGTCARVCPRKAIYKEGSAPEVPPASEQRSFDTDLLIIGSGPSGLCAAVRTALQGKKVLILEALNVPGGCGWYATFMRVFGSKWEKDAGLPDNTEDYIRAAMNCTHWMLDYKLVSTGLRAVPEFFDWFCEWGKPEEVLQIRQTLFGMGVDMIPGKANAPYITQKLLDKVNELGVKILLNTKAVSLKTDGGKVVGAVAQDSGGDIDISCKACFIATGNMACNDEIARFVPEYARAAHNRNAHRMPGATGDGIRIAEQAGIAIDDKGVACHYLGAMPTFFDGDVVQQGIRCEGVRVNMNGERFTSECTDRFEAVNQLVKQPECLSYNIIDAEILKQPIRPTIKLPTDIAGNLPAGIPQPGKPLPMVDFMGFPVPVDEDGNPLPNPLLDIGPQAAMKRDSPETLIEKFKGFRSLKGRQVCVADTIEELAEQMGVPAENLKKTIERYNEMAESGCDLDFGKYPNYMIPLKNPPYIAFKCYLGSDGAFGGLFINEKCQVLNNGEPVKGLWCGGDVTSGNFVKVMQRRYEMINDFTWALASGFIAARDICSRI